MSFGDNLRALIEERDITQKELTDYLLDHSVKECSTRQENELLRVFRSLSEEQQYICIEQSKVFMLVNQKRK